MTREASSGDSGNPPADAAFARERRLEKRNDQFEQNLTG
jgi:hypothetical protein